MDSAAISINNFVSGGLSFVSGFFHTPVKSGPAPVSKPRKAKGTYVFSGAVLPASATMPIPQELMIAILDSVTEALARFLQEDLMRMDKATANNLFKGIKPQFELVNKLDGLFNSSFETPGDIKLTVAARNFISYLLKFYSEIKVIAEAPEVDEDSGEYHSFLREQMEAARTHPVYKSGNSFRDIYPC